MGCLILSLPRNVCVVIREALLSLSMKEILTFFPPMHCDGRKFSLSLFFSFAFLGSQPQPKQCGMATQDPLTHWARPGIEPKSSRIPFGSVACWVTVGIPKWLFFIMLKFNYLHSKTNTFFFFVFLGLYLWHIGGSQARGPVGAVGTVGAGLHPSLNSVGSELCLQLHHSS